MANLMVQLGFEHESYVEEHEAPKPDVDIPRLYPQDYR